MTKRYCTIRGTVCCFGRTLLHVSLRCRTSCRGWFMHLRIFSLCQNSCKDNRAQEASQPPNASRLLSSFIETRSSTWVGRSRQLRLPQPGLGIPDFPINFLEHRFFHTTIMTADTGTQASGASSPSPSPVSVLFVCLGNICTQFPKAPFPALAPQL